MGKSTKLTDEQIMDLFFDRDERAILETDKRYGKMLLKIAYNILYDFQDCEECKNDTYFATWKAIPPSRPTMFSVFLSKIMRNIAANRFKEKVSQKRIPSELVVSIEELQDFLLSTSDIEIEYEAKEVGKIISEYVQTLPERQRLIFMDRFYMAQTIEQIAKEHGVAAGTVHRDLQIVKEGLKAHLERNGVCL